MLHPAWARRMQMCSAQHPAACPCLPTGRRLRQHSPTPSSMSSAMVSHSTHSSAVAVRCQRRRQKAAPHSKDIRMARPKHTARRAGQVVRWSRAAGRGGAAAHPTGQQWHAGTRAHARADERGITRQAAARAAGLTGNGDEPPPLCRGQSGGMKRALSRSRGSGGDACVYTHPSTARPSVCRPGPCSELDSTGWCSTIIILGNGARHTTICSLAAQPNQSPSMAMVGAS